MDWNLEERLIKMESVPGSYLDHIATYIRQKNFPIVNIKQLSTYITRNAKVAKDLEGFTSKQLIAVIEKLENEYKERERLLKLGKRTDNWKWTLETCLKELMK